jgi:hypothetical protein
MWWIVFVVVILALLVGGLFLVQREIGRKNWVMVGVYSAILLAYFVIGHIVLESMGEVFLKTK